MLQTLDRQLTAVIKTFDRPRVCRRLIASIRAQFPTLPIIVADDGKVPLGEGDYEYLRLPFDVGISAGRNAAVARVQTPYLWMFDDDHVLRPNTDVSKEMALLAADTLDVIGARVWNAHNNQEGLWRGVYEPVNRKLHVHRGVLSHHEGYSRVHLTEQCFLARTEIVRQHPWHPADKIGGCNHWGFFYRLYLAGVAVGVSHDLWVTHDQPRGSLHYRTYRRRRQFRLASFERHGFDGELVWTSPVEQQPDLPHAPVINVSISASRPPEERYDMRRGSATGIDPIYQPKVACLCPTYKRPRELANAIECFLRQDYPAELREMIVLDDAGQYAPDAISAPGVKLITTPHRFRTLGEKRNASAALASPDALIYCVWDDDDAYLPWHITAAVEALQRTGADYSVPSAIYYENSQEFVRRRNEQQYHGSWAFRRAAFELVGGYPWMQSGQDRVLMHRFKSASLQRADPIRFEPCPSFIYRRGTTPSGWHISELDRQEGYLQVADKPSEFVQQLTPALEKDWLDLTKRFFELDARTSAMPFSVIVPCRDLGEERTCAWVWVRKQLVESFPNAEIILSGDGESGDTPFNRSRAIMNGVAQASHDILVITDADVWSCGLLDAIDAVAMGAPWATPHGNVHRLGKTVTERIYAGYYPMSDSVCERPPYIGNVGGGLLVASKDTLQRVPFDTRFAGWGREDDAWQMAADVLLPAGVRFEYPLYHFWHPPQDSSAGRKSSPNDEIYSRYCDAAGDRKAMQLLLDEINIPTRIATQQ